MGAKAVRLKIRLFLEGIEVPVISAQVQCEPNAPAVAVMQIPPLPEGQRLMPRTLVHLFFLDLHDQHFFGPEEVAEQQTNPSVYEQKIRNGTSAEIDQEERNEQYKLLFCGELVQFQYTKNAANRALVLQCQDLSNYWDSAQQWENTDLFGPGMKAMFSGGSTNMFTDFLSSQDEEIVKALTRPSVQFPALKGLLGGIIHLLETIGGSYYGDKKFSGQNVFYSLAELRLKLTQCITAYDKDDTANKLLNASGYDALFGRILGNLGQQVSFRQAIVALMQVIFHETYAVTTPRFIPGTFGTTSGQKRSKLKNDPKTRSLAIGAEGSADQLRLIAKELELATEPHNDPVVRGGVQRGLATMLASIQRQLAQARKLRVDVAIRFYTNARSLLSRANAKSKVGGWKPSAPSKIKSEIVDLLNQAADSLHRIAILDRVETKKDKAIPARLNNQIFRPDIWFTSPPKCNVLFPDHYTQVSYARNYLQEPTRLLLKTNDAFFGEDELFDNFYFAPKGVTTRDQKRSLQSLLSGELLDHELFTGVIPVFEKMSETNIFSIRSGAVDGKIPKIGLAQRTTNFLYFKYRFASRQMQVNARFNPYIVCGFPGLVIDKFVDLDRLTEYERLLASKTGVERDIRDHLGTHYLASFTSVTHIVDQAQGGSTSISCTYARDFNESVEFLGAIELDQTTVRTKTGDARRTTDVAALTRPPLGSLGPNLGIITKIEDVTNTYNTGDAETASLPLYVGARRADGKATIRVPVGVVATAQTFGPEVEKLVSSPFQVVTFKAYRVHEETPQYKRAKVDLPAEEYIRPGWYGDAWNTVNVGKVYDSFFRTGSITDPTSVYNPNDGSTTSTQKNDAFDGMTNPTGVIDNPADMSEPRVAAISLQEKASIAQGVAFLVHLYSHIKLSGLDADEFISAYTWRPIASLPDMFGSSDLTLSKDGIEVLKGVEGFHSRAFGPYEDLFGLVPPEIEDVLDMGRSSKQAKKNDTRKRKYDKVMAYVSVLKYSRAIVG
jgi:hypothetical protein